MASQTQSANAIGYAKHRSRSHDAVIRVYDESGNVIEMHEHKGDFKEWWVFARITRHFRLRRISMIPLSSAERERRKRIRQNNSVKYYGKIPSKVRSAKEARFN